MTETSLTDSLLGHLGYAAFYYAGRGNFRPMGRLPDWFEKLSGLGGDAPARVRLASMYPFVANFLLDASKAWRSQSGTWARSGIWLERGADGREIPLECSAFSLGQKRILVLSSPHDHYEETRQLLQTARVSRLQYDSFMRDIQKKEILLHCIIHDLSQPLTAMRGCFSSLSLAKLPPKLRELVEIGNQQSHEQESMIREVVRTFAAELSAPQVVQGGSSDAPNLARVAMEAVRDFSAAFAEQEVKLELDLSVDLNRSWQVVGDDSRLRRIYSNLLENALRHSPKGSTVTVRVSDEVYFLSAFVDDRGPGLPPNQAPTQLFQLFSKGKERGGKAGLGLYFCKITVERWGGTIGCESRSGGGARFWFRLPRHAPERAENNEAASTPASPSPTQVQEPAATPRRPLRILLADDTAVVRKLATHMLRERGHKVTSAIDGRDALAKFRRQKFDVVLMDAEMPKRSGLDATRAIRLQENETGAHTPIIAMTAYATEAERTHCLKAGMNSCLPKPFSAEDLYRAIENSGVTPAATEAEAEGNPPSAGGWRDTLMARVGGNARLLASLVRVFLSDCPKKISRIRRAIIHGDGKLLASAAHALKGPVAILFGDGEPALMTRKLEAMGRIGDLAGATEACDDLERNLVQLCHDLEKFQKTLPMSLTGKSQKSPTQSERSARTGTRRRRP